MKEAQEAYALAVNKLKKRSLGNIHFIGELFKLSMLTENIMHECIVKLLTACDEESLELMCKLMKTTGAKLDHEKAQVKLKIFVDLLMIGHVK